MKNNKFLLFTICLLCFFGFKLNAKADNTTIIFDFDNANVQNVVNNNQSLINDIQSYINLNNTRNFYYNISIRNTRYLIVGLGAFTSDYIWYMPSLSGTTFYQGATQGLNFNDNQNVKPSNFSCIGNCYTKYFELDLNNLSDSSISTFKSSILSFLNSPTGYNGVSPQVVTYNVNYNYFLNTNNFFVYYSSLPLYFKKYSTNSAIFDIKVGDTIFHQDSFFPSYSDYFSSLTPTLSVTNLTPIKDNYNNIIKYYVDVSFSVFDTDNFKYQYCLDNICDDFLSNNTRLELYQNGSYVFQILDNDDELIDSTSLTISNINIETPFIDYTLSVPDSCVAYIDNVSRNMCKSLKMEWGTSNGNYIYQYSVNNLDFENIYGSYSLLLVQNDTVVMRVIDNDNDVLWSYTLTINDLYTVDNSLGIFTTFNQTNFGNNSSVSNYLEVYIYNLDLSYIDNVYISYDGFNFSKLDVYNRGTFFYALSNALYSSQQVYINIKDNNDEIIYSTSYYVDMSQVANKGLLSYLENFNLSMNGPISTFVTTPIRFFQNVLNSSSVCSPLVLPTRIGNMSLPCMKSVYSSISNDLYNIIETIFSGILVYYCGLSLIKTLKSLVSPTDDRIEVVDL